MTSRERVDLQRRINSRNTIYSIKRFMGRKFDEVQEEIKRVPYKVVRAANGDAAVGVTVDGKAKQFTPPEISAMILFKLKADAAEHDQMRQAAKKQKEEDK